MSAIVVHSAGDKHRPTTDRLGSCPVHNLRGRSQCRPFEISVEGIRYKEAAAPDPVRPADAAARFPPASREDCVSALVERETIMQRAFLRRRGLCPFHSPEI